KLESADSGANTGMVFGREGGHVLVNGREGAEVTFRAGVPQRWRIVNAAKSRYFYLYLDGVTMTTIGVDGGLLDKPIVSDRILLTPGQRADVILTPQGKPGEELILMNLPFNRGYGSTEFRGTTQMMMVELAKMPPVSVDVPKLPTRTIEPLDTTNATQVK